MGNAETIRGLEPLLGEVVPIRTIQETQPPELFDDAYVAEVNVKAASKLIKVIDSAFPRDPSLPASHLRRFCRGETLPAPLKATIEAKRSSAIPQGVQTIFVMVAPPLPPVDKLLELLAPYSPSTSASPSNITSSDTSTPANLNSNILLVTTRVPLQPPFNAAQAETWTKTMWPVIFNPAAPRSTVAPPPQILSRAHDSIQPRAGYYLALSRRVAEEAKQLGRGRAVGAVIVDPAIEAEIEASAFENGDSNTEQWMNAVIAVGGDARYGRPEAGGPSQAELHPGVVPNPACKMYNADLEGGPDLHALMRATELVARRRREDPVHEAEILAKYDSIPSTGDPQLSTQLSPLESYFLYEADAKFIASASNARRPSDSLKRKPDEPNPESGSTSLEFNSETSSNPTTSQISDTPLPAPPPSTTALADPPIPQPNNDPTHATSGSTSTHSETNTATHATSRIRSRAQGGYLCTDLDVYLSHEPCLCCSMGILLSRFRAVIFPRQGRMKSGGISSEPVIAPIAVENGDNHQQNGHTQRRPAADRLYYGLHWRKELNWRALGFEFVEDGECVGDSAGSDVVFHA